MYTVYFYGTPRGKYPVKDFIERLDKRSRAKIWRYIELLEKQGPNLLRPYADHVQDEVRELRVRLKDGNIRVFYFFFERVNVVLLNAFKKKTGKLPEKEISRAKRNMNNFLLRYSQGDLKL